MSVSLEKRRQKKRRRGSVLIVTLIVMIFLVVVSGGVFSFAYTNHRSEELQSAILKARVAADSILYAVGSVISDDFKRPSPVISLDKNVKHNANFTDGPFSGDVTIFTSDDRNFSVTCSMSYGGNLSRKRTLTLVKSRGSVARWQWGEW